MFERVDGWIGQRVEAAIGAHHRRRLRRVGRIDQLDPPHSLPLWAAGDPAPRTGCALEVLVDGGEALPRIAEADPSAGLLTESLMATIAEMSPEATQRLRDFLEKRAAKVLRQS